MTRENVEIVRRGFDAYRRGGIPAMLESAVPDQITYRAEPDGATYQGRSGAPIEADFWFVHTLSDGKITRLDMFASKAQAFEAAGLPAA